MIDPPEPDGAALTIEPQLTLSLHRTNPSAHLLGLEAWQKIAFFSRETPHSYCDPMFEFRTRYDI
jgi:hypothetical protein